MDTAASAPTLEDLKARVRHFRRRHRLSQREAAQALSVSQPTLARLEGGHDVRYSVGALILLRMAAYAPGTIVRDSDRVERIWTKRVIALSPSHSIQQVDDRMTRDELSHAPVRKGRRELGPLVSRDEVQRLIATGMDPRTKLGDALTAMKLQMAPRLAFDRPISEARVALSAAPLVLVTRYRQVRGVVTAHNLAGVDLSGK